MVRGHKVATRLATRADKDRQGDTEEGIEVMDDGHAKPLADPVGGGLEGVEHEERRRPPSTAAL